MAKITEEEARKLTGEKVMKLQALAKELKIEMTAEIKITQNMTVAPVVIFTDREEYDIEKKAPVMRGPMTKLPDHVLEKMKSMRPKPDENKIPPSQQ